MIDRKLRNDRRISLAAPTPLIWHLDTIDQKQLPPVHEPPIHQPPVAKTPEPATLVLGLIGAAIGGLVARRRR